MIGVIKGNARSLDYSSRSRINVRGKRQHSEEFMADAGIGMQTLNPKP